MKTSDFDYILPPERIAQHPADRRDASRMLVVHRAEGRWEDRAFGDLPLFLRKNDLLVANDTRVIPVRVMGRKEASGGQVELFFLEDLSGGRWDVLMRASRRPKPGSRILFAGGEATATLLRDGELGRAEILVESNRPVLELLESCGEPPLPPYIARREGLDPTDRERYQTVYAREPGAVAAPTAGLHFTPGVFAQLDALGVRRAMVTLHVGLGTFRPVSAEAVADHRMEAERFVLSEATAEAVRQTRTVQGRILAVGSTSVRTLETCARDDGTVQARSGRSDLFIHPPYRFKAVDLMLTNFHLPKSTLLMMVCAFAGRELAMEAYRHAVEAEYRFFSYGDCMLIL